MAAKVCDAPKAKNSWEVCLPRFVMLHSVFFETLLFGLTIAAMLRQEKRRSFSTLSLLLYRDGKSQLASLSFSALIYPIAGMLYFVAVTGTYNIRVVLRV